jgi:hypothetical protein
MVKTKKKKLTAIVVMSLTLLLSYSLLDFYFASRQINAMLGEDLKRYESNITLWHQHNPLYSVKSHGHVSKKGGRVSKTAVEIHGKTLLGPITFEFTDATSDRICDYSTYEIFTWANTISKKYDKEVIVFEYKRNTNKNKKYDRKNGPRLAIVKTGALENWDAEKPVPENWLVF